MKANWLHGLIFALIVLGGVLLWPARTAARSVAVGALVIVLVLCGVFMPTFSRQMLNGILASAILVIVVAWLVEYLRHRPPRRSTPAAPPSPLTPSSAPPEVPPQAPPSAFTPAAESPSPSQQTSGGQRPASDAERPASASEEGGASHA